MPRRHDQQFDAWRSRGGRVISMADQDEARAILGSRLRAARIHRGLSARRLAMEAGGFSEAMVRVVERGASGMSMTTLVAFALRLEVSTDWLLGLTDRPPAGMPRGCA